jgi:hypothetical protein
MNRPLLALGLALAALAQGPLAHAREPLRVVAGYTARSFQDVLTLFRQTRMAAFRPEYLLGTEALVRENRRLRVAVRAGDRSP